MILGGSFEFCDISDGYFMYQSIRNGG
jgi:hypothetical protein